MPRARKKPVEIEYVQWTGENLEELADFYDGLRIETNILTSEHHLIIPTLEGDMRASIGDYIIKGVMNEIYPCKPHIFEATYDFPI